MVLVRSDRLRAKARDLTAGLEGEIALALGVIMPARVVIESLDAFRAAFPRVAVRMLREEVGGAPELVAEGVADLGVAGDQSLAPYAEDAFDRVPLGTVGVLAVAAPHHALATLDRPLTDADIEDHRQLVPTSRALPRYQHTLVHDVWEVSDLELRHAMIRRGMGWGTLPVARVQADLDAGSLVPLRIDARPEAALKVPLYAIHRTDDAPGPARRWLIDRWRGLVASPTPPTERDTVPTRTSGDPARRAPASGSTSA